MALMMVLAWLAPAHAQSWSGTVEVSADSRVVVTRHHSLGDYDIGTVEVDYVEVANPALDEVHARYTLSRDEDLAGKGPEREVGDGASLWAVVEPTLGLRTAAKGETSPDGSYGVEVVQVDPGSEASDGPGESEVILRDRTGLRVTLARLATQDYGHTEIVTSWVPDRVVVTAGWVSGSVMRGPPPHAMRHVVQRLDGHIAIALPDALAAVGGPRARAALQRAGQGGWTMTTAQKTRDKTTLYAAKGEEERARAIAAMLPIEARIEPLTWQSPAAVVFAVGRDLAQAADPTPERATPFGRIGDSAVVSIPRWGGTVLGQTGQQAWDGPADPRAAHLPPKALAWPVWTEKAPFEACSRTLERARPVVAFPTLRALFPDPGEPQWFFAADPDPEREGRACVVPSGSAVVVRGQATYGDVIPIRRRIAVKVPPSGTTDRMKGTVRALSNQGLVSVTAAQSERTGNALYVKETVDPDFVKDLASRLGGVAAEPLTWDAGADVVVVLAKR